MKNFEKVFLMDNPKKVGKIHMSLENGSGLEYLEACLEEAKRSSAQDLFKAQVMITDSYLVFYGDTFGKRLFIIPLSEIVNVYSTNCFNGNYDYSCKSIAVELCDGRVLYISRCMRKQKVDHYYQVIEILQNRCKNNQGSLM